MEWAVGTDEKQEGRGPGPGSYRPGDPVTSTSQGTACSDDQAQVTSAEANGGESATDPTRHQGRRAADGCGAVPRASTCH